MRWLAPDRTATYPGDRTKGLIMQLFAAVKQFAIRRPDFQEITAVGLVFFSLTLSRTDV
jgi:glycerol kinase